MRGISFVAVLIGLLLGAAVGWLVGRLVRSDNVPFFVALAALAGLWAGLAWSRVLRLRVLVILGLLALALLVLLFTPPRAHIRNLPDEPAIAGSPASQADGPTAGQAATLSSLSEVTRSRQT